MVQKPWFRKRFWGLVVGLTVTLLTVFGHVSGYLDGLDRIYLDFCFCHANRIPADPDIVMVDINDLALERISRWPWPRQLQADLVNVLSECGAESIILDLVYSEPMRPRVELPELDPNTEIPAELISTANTVYDDRELAQAISNAGNVYVGMYFPLYPPQDEPVINRKRARELLNKNPDINIMEFSSRLGATHDKSAVRTYLLARIDHLLHSDFGLNVSQLAQKLSESPSEIEKVITSAKEIAAADMAEEFLNKNPNATFNEFFNAALPDHPADVISRDQKDLEVAYEHAQTARLVYAKALGNSEPFRKSIPNGTRPTIPINPITQAAKEVGFVSFETDVDGVLRYVPLLANVDGRLVCQLGFAAACDALDIDTDTITVSSDRLLTFSNRTGDTTWKIPLNKRGEMLLNWNIGKTGNKWYNSFHHVPVARIMEVALNRRTISENNAKAQMLVAQAVELMYQDARSAYLDYEEKLRTLNKDNGENLQQLREEVESIEKNAIAQLTHLTSEIENLQPEDDYEAVLFPKINNLADKLIKGNFVKKIKKANQNLTDRNEELLKELRQRIGGKLCFVGYTAAAQADMVNTPVFEDMPGVMAHANLVNTLLNNRTPVRASKIINTLLILLSGLIITLVTKSRGPWVSLVSMVLVVTSAMAISMLSMWIPSYYLSSLTAVTGGFVAWALITLYRQLTEQKHRRSVVRELSRNTSPAIAAIIAEQLEDLDLPPKPADVTCYFSDLQGFTTISERLGAEQTKTILNTYLGAMGEELVRFKAFNKFMGDGIFAFFNAPILPVQQHAKVGCQAAIETIRRLEQLKNEYSGACENEMKNLWMRIGLHTGPVFVGYFGSNQQTDYTCIGDTVNLAARLESANKPFGTQVMVTEHCRDEAGEGFEYRHLGSLQVKGKAQAVPVYELLGHSGEVPDDTLRYAELFSKAIHSFQTRLWDSARGQFQTCLETRSDDPAALLYMTEINRLQNSPPPENWNQAIELSTK